jgi:hypothetical protein
MRFRKLRIVWSAFWGLACVLLIVLWVRSYWWADEVYVPLTDRHTVAVGSILGGISISPWLPTVEGYFNAAPKMRTEKYGEPPSALINSRTPREQLARIAKQEGVWAYYKRHPPKPIRFGIVNNQTHYTILLPYFVLCGFAGFSAACPWLPCRFTLRTLLIVTTLVAVVLGTIVYAIR